MKRSSLASFAPPSTMTPQKNHLNQRQGWALINLGGTTYTLATQNGAANNVVELKRGSTPKLATEKEVAAQLVADLVQPYISYFKKMSKEERKEKGAVVLAMPGLVTKEGIVQTCGNVGIPANFDMKEALRAEFEKHGINGLAIGVVNDAVAPANANYGHLKNPIFVINGTGTGGTVTKFISGEFGHARLNGASGKTIEETVSGKALAAKAQELAKKAGLKTFLGINTSDLYSDKLDSNLYDQTLRHVFANHPPFQDAATYLKKDDTLVQKSLSTKEKEVLKVLDDHLHNEMGRLLAILRCVNPTADGMVLNGSVTDYLNLEKLQKAINANIGDTVKGAIGIKNTDFFIKVEAGKALEGAANMARDLLKQSKGTQAVSQSFPVLQTGLALVVGAGLGFLGKGWLNPTKPVSKPVKSEDKATSVQPPEDKSTFSVKG